MKKNGVVKIACVIMLLILMLKVAVASPGIFAKIFFRNDVESAGAEVPIPIAEMKPFAGRIAYSADGNYHDEDDIAANPFALMLLAKSGYKNSLVHFEYGNHIWYTRPSQLKRLDSITKVAATRFGFDSSVFFNCIENRVASYNHLKDQILASSAVSPLTILGAGPMHSIYQAIKLASNINPDKLKYVTLISHSPAKGDSSSNNEHGLYDNAKGRDPLHKHNLPEPAKVWDDIAKDFPAIRLVIIRGQNGPPDIKLQGYDFCVGYSNLDDEWMSSFPDSNVQWVWENMKAVFKNKADVSDAGMVWYWLTGGDQFGNLEKVKNALFNTFLVDQNFNYETLGSKPQKWSLNEAVTIANTPNRILQDLCMRIDDKSAKQTTYAIKTFAAQSSNLVIDFDLMFTKETSNDVAVELKTTGGTSIVVVKASDNVFKFKNRVGQWEDIGIIMKNNPQHLTICVYKSAGTCTIVLDGRIVKQKINSSNAVTDNISEVKLTTGKDYVGMVYLDNLKLYGL